MNIRYISILIILVAVTYVLSNILPYRLWIQDISTDEISYPKTLSVPSLDIESRVEFVGTTYSGAMAIPQGIQNVGWYKYGTIPGNIGNSVFAGHVDNALGTNGVFSDLDKIQRGEEIEITNIDGDIYTYIVDDMETVSWTDAPNEKIFLGDGENAGIVLITCTGDWDKVSDTYSERLVVYAKLK